MSGAGKKLFKNSRFVIKKNKENLKVQLDGIRPHCSDVQLLLRNLLFLNFTFNIYCAGVTPSIKSSQIP